LNYDFEDAMYNSPIYSEGDMGSIVTEEYIEGRKVSMSPFYQSGRYVKYVMVDDNTI